VKKVFISQKSIILHPQCEMNTLLSVKKTGIVFAFTDKEELESKAIIGIEKTK
jgi:hypothetical protein